MSYSTDTVRLLILHDSQDVAEQLITVLRGSGKAIRAELALDEDSLTSKIQSSSWDILLARPLVGGLKVEDAIIRITQMDRDIPAIVLADELDAKKITEFVQAGAAQVVKQDAREWLLEAVNRELQNLETRRRLAIVEMDLQESEKRVNLLLETSQDAVAYVTDGMHIHANDMYATLFGYEDADDMAGLPIMDLVSPQDHQELKKNLRLQNSDEDVTVEFSFHGIKENGDTFEASMEFSPASFDDEPCTQVVIRSSGGGNNAELEAQLQAAKLQDPLTGLRNSTFFVEHLDRAVQQAIKSKQFSSIFYILIDNYDSFKADLGITASDKVLQAIGSHLEDIQPEAAEVARLGDDVFAIWMNGNDEAQMSEFAEKIRSSMEALMPEIDGRTVQLTASVGAAPVTDNTPNGQTALDRAHKACDKVESNGTSIYDPAEDIPADNELAITEQLSQAIEKENFFLLYQPLYKLSGGDAVYEAFLRLQSGEDELPPSDFMHAATQMKLTPKIDRWAILQGIKQIAKKRASGEETRLVVNITGDSLADKALADWVGVALKAAKLPGNALIFQINETDATSYLKAAQAFIAGIKKIGCETSVSRFGCSLDPVKTLGMLDVDYVKLDSSFIQDLSDGEQKENTRNLLNEIHKIGKSSIAPKVESATDLSNLWQMGVTYIQGYYVMAPSREMAYDFSADDE